MKISFAETEAGQEEFFLKEFEGHDLEFCHAADCAPDTEVLSIFIETKIGDAFLEDHPALKVIVTRSTTYDHIDLGACARRGVTVCSVGGSYGDNTVPEHIFALILALTRKLMLAREVVAGRSFSYEELRGMELNGKTLGVMGTGRIGRQVLRLAKSFGMKTIGADSQPDPAAAEELGFKYVRFPKMLQMADVISINAPLTATTYHLFNRESFAKCKKGMILINTARGPIIESAALIEALDAGIIAGAGLDVLEDERVMRKKAAHILTEQIVERLHESFAPVEPLAGESARLTEVRRLMHNNALLGHPRVIVTPHIAFNSYEAIERINRTTADNIKAFIAGKPKNVVAECAVPRGKTKRKEQAKDGKEHTEK